MQTDAMPGAPNPTPRPLTLEVAAALRAELARQQRPVKELVEPTGISLSQLHKILKGEKPISLDFLEAAARTLGIDVGMVLEEAQRAVHRGRGGAAPRTLRSQSEGREMRPTLRAVAHDPGYLPEEDQEVFD